MNFYELTTKRQSCRKYDASRDVSEQAAFLPPLATVNPTTSPFAVVKAPVALQTPLRAWE